MIRLLRNLFGRAEWRFVGVASATTVLVDEVGRRTPGGRLRGYWVLEQSADGERRVTKVGDAGDSAAAEMQRARVEAWKRGGPLPGLDRGFSEDTGAAT